MALVDLKMSKKDMKEESQPSVADQNPYPYGLRINLDTDELEKLGITEKNLPAVGDEIHIEAVGSVCSVSEDDTASGGYRCGVSIQIEMMELKNEGPEDGDESAAEEEAEDAEAGETEGRSKTVMHSTYRGG